VAAAKNDVVIGYAIPADAQHVAEAYELINYLYRPEVAAKNSDFLSYANGNLASQKLIGPKILNGNNIYPVETTLSKLFVITAVDQSEDGEMTTPGASGAFLLSRHARA
jgi:spermidine/putrescine-binding protein